MMKANFTVFPVLALLGTAAFAQKPPVHQVDPFVIDVNRPYVYLKFDHLGRGTPRGDKEGPYRLWFRFVNNSNLTITLRTFGNVEGMLKDEVDIMDKVETEGRARGVIITSDSPAYNEPFQAPKPAADPKRADVYAKDLPGDYWFEVGSSLQVLPGTSVLFSLPTDHLSTKWHVEIPFDFKVPSGKGPRPDNIGGFPVQFLQYSLWDLPEEVKVQIQEKK